jgi:hypothetical protein
MEWDNELPLADEPAARRRRGAGAVLRFALPILVVVGLAVAALAQSGVLGGDDPAPTVRNVVASGIEPPVLTPLPVKLPAKKATTTTEGATAATTPPSGTATDAGTSAATGTAAAPAAGADAAAPAAGTDVPATTGGTGAPATGGTAPGSADATGTTP